MAMHYEKAMYFWHRHLEGADPETRTLRKWNAAYPDDQTTLEEITGFLTDMQKGINSGLKDARAMDDILNPKPDLKVVSRPKKGRVV